MEKNNFIFAGSLKYAVFFALIFFVIFLVFANLKQASGVLFASFVTTANLFLLEKMVRSLKGKKVLFINIFVKTLIVIATLFCGILVFGIMGVFAGIISSTVALTITTLKAGQLKCL